MANVQSVASDQGTSGGDFTVNITASLAGSTIVVGLLAAGGFSVAPTCTDNIGNSYTLLQEDNVGNSPSALFVCVNATSGVNAVTIHNGGKITAFVCEESGISALDLSNINPNQSATTTPTVAVTTSQASVIGYTFCVQGNTTVTQTQGTGWTAVTGTGITSGQRNNGTASTSAFAQRGTFTTGTINGTVNATSSSAYDNLIITLTPAAASTASIAWVV